MFNFTAGERKSITSIWGSAVQQVLRPPRSTYNVEELGNSSIIQVAVL